VNDRSRTPRYLLPAEAGLISITVGVIYGFSRVFTGASFFFPMLAVGLYAHAVTMLTRRRGFSVPVSALIGVPGLLLLGSWLFFLNTTIVGVPAPSTVTAAQDALTSSWQSFGTIVAPAAPLPGFLMASCAALFFAVFLADWASFRLWSAFEAIVPASTLFIFCSLLGSPDHKVDSSAVFLASILGFLLLHRTARQETSAGWLTADIDRGSQAGLRAGAALTGAALAFGVVLGPVLPGAASPPLLSLRGGDGGGPGSRITISPLVDIKDRLVNQTDVEVFTVESNQRAYWRMTSLDTFEGDIWRSGGKYTSVDGDLDAPAPGPGVSTVTATQTYTITKLKVLWLPAAFEPVHVESEAEVRFQADSATLIVNTNQENSDTMTYKVESVLPRFTVDQLRSANATVPNDLKRYLTLPNGFSSTARSVAMDQTKGMTTPYDKARALQDYFQNNYAYDLSVANGHGANAIDTFLSARKGYCEQFAGTFAAMARAIGLPARVAVGFTPGEQDAVNKNLFHVRGEHAHAWPEVYLGEYGWVPFEPTPERGAPNAESWTGLPERQENNGAPVTPNNTSAPTSLIAPVPTSQVDPGATTTTAAPTTTTTAAPATRPAEERWFTTLARRTFFLALLLALLAVVYAVAVTSVKDARRKSRRHAAADPSARVRVAWKESVEALSLLGTVHAPNETHEEFATRAGPKLDQHAPVFIDLAHDVDAASYAPEILTDDVAVRATAASTLVIEHVHAKVASKRQWQDRLDIRPLLPKRRTSTRRRASSRDR
jgi:transglutaminase-like putative cysteine protease